MNLIASVADNLQHFSNSNELLLALVSGEVQNADDHTRGGLQEMFNMVDENTPQVKKDWLTDLVRKIAYYDDTPPIFKVNRGENFSFQIDLEQGRDFSGFNLTVRHADTHALLSPNDTQGDSYANEPVQYAYINDLDLQEDEFFKVHVLLEETDSNDLATGEAVTLLTESWLIVGESIDA